MRRSIATRVVAGAAVASLTCAGFLLQAPVASSQSEETPAAPTPTATPSPPDLAVAERLAGAGDSEGAIAAYRAYVESGAPGGRAEALLDLAKLLFNDGQPAGAASQLDVYLFEAAPGEDVIDAQLLLAEALLQSGDPQGALPLYDLYLASDNGAHVYALVGRAKALAGVGRSIEAEAEAEALLDQDLPAVTTVGLMTSLAETFEAQADTAGALEWYGRLAVAGSPSEQATALWRSALIKLQEGDESWRSDVQTIIQRYPSTQSAREAANAFLELRGTIDDYYFGLVHYQHGEDSEARAIFEEILAGPPQPNAARASYYLAMIDERAGDLESALAGYARVLEIAPNIELADDALWWRGRLLESLGRSDEAAEAYQRLADQHTGSDRGREARFRLALLDYSQGEYAVAADAYARIAADTTDDDRQRALLWQGKAMHASGNLDAAEAVWEGLAEGGKESYFALRAAALLGEASGTIDDDELDVPGEPDWTEIARWLDESQGRVATPTPAPPSNADAHVRLGRHLSALGMQRPAEAEYDLALESAGGSPDDLFGLTRQFYTLGLHHLSAKAATRLLTAVDTESASAAPEHLWHLAYPVPYSDELLEATSASDAPPLLLLAMIRQESFFNPRAGSPAGAIGLTQVIEPTGEAIAFGLGIERFNLEALYQPGLSLRFGAYYLSEQLAEFDGNLYQALAAYNAGPGNAGRWAAGSQDDVDWFYEEIDFAETRLYIKLVTENFARYRYLHGSASVPSLPEG